MRILHLDSGLFAEQSVTRALSADIVARLNAKNSDADVVYRDLIADPIAHLDATIILAGGKDKEARNEHEQRQVELTETLLDELFTADVLVIAVPMYNFTIPSQLKAWFDRVLQAGRTFKYTDSGAQGLVTGKTVYLASSRGGVYSEGPAAAIEHQESYVTAALNFIGITDIQVIRAEGVNLGEEAKETAIRAAKQQITAL